MTEVMNVVNRLTGGRGQLRNMVVRRTAATRVMDSKITPVPKTGPPKQQAMVSSRSQSVRDI